MSLPLDDRYRDIVRDHIAPVLKQEGYKRAGNKFWREYPTLNWMVELQRHTYDRREFINFTVNFGWHAWAIVRLMFSRPLPASPVLTSSAFRWRIGFFMPKPHDKWWKLAATSDPAAADARIGAEVEQSLVKHVFPFLHQYRSLDELGAALKNGSDRVLQRNLPVGYEGIVQRGLALCLTGDRRGGLTLIRALAAQHHPTSPAGEWIHDVLGRITARQ